MIFLLRLFPVGFFIAFLLTPQAFANNELRNLISINLKRGDSLILSQFSYAFEKGETIKSIKQKMAAPNDWFNKIKGMQKDIIPIEKQVYYYNEKFSYNPDPKEGKRLDDDVRIEDLKPQQSQEVDGKKFFITHITLVVLD
jgi:uncharacterized protein YxjI